MTSARVRRAILLHHEQAAARRERFLQRGGLSDREVFERVNAVPLQQISPAESAGREGRKETSHRVDS